MLQLYYGNGKGKTTAATGAAIRALGSGMHVMFVQFLKNGDSSECSILKKFDNLNFLVSEDQYSLFSSTNNSKTARIRQANNSLFRRIIQTDILPEMLVFDELLDVLEKNLIDFEMVLQFLKTNKYKSEIIITGHTEFKSIVEMADYVSEIRQIRHPYNNGVAARLGIEF